MEYQEISNQKTWDDFVAKNHGHPLQFWAWGQVKSSHGWSAQRIFFKKNQKILASAQILKKTLPRPFPPLLYCPRGPVIADPKNRKIIFESLTNFAKLQKCLALKIDPHILESENFIPPKPFKKTKNNILLSETALIDLTKPLDEIKNDYTKKTRQYINKSFREIKVEKLQTPLNSYDFKEILKIYHETATRANFALHSDEYYRDIYKFMGENSQIFVARTKNLRTHQDPQTHQKSGQEPLLAFLWLATSPSVAFELYGGINTLGQKLRANYYLKQFAIEACKNQKIQQYDLNGLLNDGVSNFKLGFAKPVKLIGVYDFPNSPLYPLWERTLPSAKKIIRKIRQN